MLRSFPTLDPDDRLVHWFDATDFAADEGSPVATITVGIDDNPDGALTIINAVQNGSVISFIPLNPTEGESYVIRGRCTLANGEQADESITVTGERH